TPGELKSRGASLEIRFGYSPSPFGLALIAATPRGICHLSFAEDDAYVDDDAQEGPLLDLRRAWPEARLIRDDRLAGETAVRIWGRGAGEHELRVHVAGTNFQLQ